MIGIKIKMPRNCQLCPLAMREIEENYGPLLEKCTCPVNNKTTKYQLRKHKQGRPPYCPLSELKGDNNDR